MLLAGVIAPGLRCALAITQEIFPIPAFDGMRKPVAELRNPSGWRRIPTVAAELAQIVRCPAGGQNKHAFVAQFPQSVAQPQMMRGTQRRLHGQLRDRNIGFGIHE